jgi:hypothetical protein
MAQAAQSALAHPLAESPSQGALQGALPWHCIETYARHEPLVRDEIIALGVPAYLPTFQRPTRDRTRFARPIISVPSPLFPSYLFAQFASSDTSVHSAILHLRKVRSVLGVVRESFVCFVSAQCSENEKREEMLEFGTRVKIVQGPFAGVGSGIVELCERDRVRLLLDAIGKPTISLPRADVALL